MHQHTRRDFLKVGVGSAIAGLAPVSAATKKSATDLVTLGNSNVKVTRLAFGTGTFGGRVQRDLGQEAFTRLVRHAYDRGIRFFETADAYREMPQMLAVALKGLPRDSYQLMTKYRVRDQQDIRGTIDRLRSDLNAEYVDIMLMHCLRSPTWPDEMKRLQDELSEAKHRKIISSHGASVHGLPGLRNFPSQTKWLDVALLRVNHAGVKMDSESTQDTEDLGSVPEVFKHAKAIHSNGVGVLGMKLIGEGRFTKAEDREAAMKQVLKSGCVDAVTIGFKNIAEIDESVDRMNRLLNA